MQSHIFTSCLLTLNQRINVIFFYNCFTKIKYIECDIHFLHDLAMWTKNANQQKDTCVLAKTCHCISYLWVDDVCRKPIHFAATIETGVQWYVLASAKERSAAEYDKNFVQVFNYGFCFCEMIRLKCEPLKIIKVLSIKGYDL